MDIIVIKTPTDIVAWLRDDLSKNKWQVMDESAIAQRRPGYRDLNEKARARALSKMIKAADYVRPINLTAPLANTKEICNDRSKGALTLLRAVELYRTPRAGMLLVATLLAGLHAHALKGIDPSLFFSIALPASDVNTEAARQLVNACVTRNRWKMNTAIIQRESIIDCSANQSLIGCKVQDFTSAHPRKCKKLTAPYPYIDTSAMILNADRNFMYAAAPLLSKAAVFLVNCDTRDLRPIRLKTVETDAYDPDCLKILRTNRNHIASVLFDWWALDEEDRWAQNIVARAKQSFGPPDSRYVSVTYDPVKLRMAVLHQVVLSFLQFCAKCDWLTPEQSEHYQVLAGQVFHPEAQSDKPTLKIEDPMAFVPILRKALESSLIIAKGEPYGKANKALGAYRTISGRQYLVMPEETWAKAFKRAAKELNFDISFTQRPHWSRTLQSILGEVGYIKTPSAGVRYRYDLYGTGKRDSTYVIAVPIELLNGSTL